MDALTHEHVDQYADVISGVARLVAAGELAAAANALAPIAGEVWTQRSPVHVRTNAEPSGLKRGYVSKVTKARVYLRDGYVCTYCGGRAVALPVLAGISALFPSALPYSQHFKLGATHPVYWLLAAEADHNVAFAAGGADDESNFTTLHALCNTQKADAARDLLPEVTPRPAPAGWDGLVSTYPPIASLAAAAGGEHGPRYYADWERAFTLAAID